MLVKIEVNVETSYDMDQVQRLLSADSAYHALYDIDQSVRSILSEDRDGEPTKEEMIRVFKEISYSVEETRVHELFT